MMMMKIHYYYQNNNNDDDVNRLSNNPRDQLEAFDVYGRSWNRLSSGVVILQQ